VFLTYGSEVSDYSDLSDQMRALCVGTNNRAGEREHEILDELKPLPNERVFNKITPSAFTSTPIEIVLRTYGVDTLLFTGVSTNMCVEHTMRDAASYGFYCFLVEDACGADSPAMHEAAVTVVQRLYGAVVSTDEAIAQMEAKLPAAVQGA
jgi:nicotinamidase-related amidase